MKFNCGLTREEKLERKRAKALKDDKEWFTLIREWHDWFAWYPVRVGPRDCRWLEVVECKDVSWYAGLDPSDRAERYNGSDPWGDSSDYGDTTWTYRAKETK